MHTILYVGDFSASWTTESYVARALERAGCTVVRFDPRRLSIEELETHCRLQTATIQNRLNTLLFAKPAFGGTFDWEEPATTLKMLELTRPYFKKQVCWIFDLLNPGYRVERYCWAAAVSQAVDLFCTTDGSIVDFLDNAKLLRQAAPDDVRPGRILDDLRCDVLWLGGLYGQRREEADRLIRHFKRRLWIIESGFRGDELADVMASAKVVIGPSWPHFAGYWSNRIYVVTAHGGIFVTPQDEALEAEGWQAWRHYLPVVMGRTGQGPLPPITVDPIEQAISLAESTLKTSGLIRPHTGERARDFCLAHHTYDIRVKKLLEWIT